jgi:hypothetical protein
MTRELMMKTEMDFGVEFASTASFYENRFLNKENNNNLYKLFSRQKL